MISVDYSHDVNRELHTVAGATEALKILFPDEFPASVLDVGAGTGTWLCAAAKRGARDLLGVEGLDMPAEKLFVDKQLILHRDLNQPFDAGRRFDLVMSFETAEHIEPENADLFVDTLVRHGDTILFSAASPRQPGTHHVTCEWPSFWQQKFNARGFVCDDEPRWKLWTNPAVEPWYRQNMIRARRDEAAAGREPRILPVVHPDLVPHMAGTFLADHARMIEQGVLRWPWYVTAPVKAALAKLRFKLAN